MDPSSTWPETLSLASGCPWIPGLPSRWHLGTRPPQGCCPIPAAGAEPPCTHMKMHIHTQTHMLRIPPVTGLRHLVYPVDGSQIPQSPIASCMTKHACKWVSQPTPRPHSVPVAGLDPLVPPVADSQTSAGFLSHLPYSLSSLAWLMLSGNTLI